jgi:hypothetical protein
MNNIVYTFLFFFLMNNCYSYENVTKSFKIENLDYAKYFSIYQNSDIVFGKIPETIPAEQLPEEVGIQIDVDQLYDDDVTHLKIFVPNIEPKSIKKFYTSDGFMNKTEYSTYDRPSNPEKISFLIKFVYNFFT